MKNNITRLLQLFLLAVTISGGLLYGLRSSQVYAAAPQGCYTQDPATGVVTPNACPADANGGPAGVCYLQTLLHPGISASAPTNCSNINYTAPGGNPGGGAGLSGPGAPVPSDCNAAVLNKDNCGIIKWLLLIIDTLSALVGVAVVLSIIFGGIKYSMATDDPAQIAAAKDRIKNGLIALVTFMAMFSFLQWVIPGGIF